MPMGHLIRCEFWSIFYSQRVLTESVDAFRQAVATIEFASRFLQLRRS